MHKLQRSLSQYILNKLKTNVIIHNTFVSQALGKLLIPGLGYQGFKDLKWYTKEYIDETSGMLGYADTICVDYVET